jgi:maltooligosyltrehalose trehalohydrolase
VRRDPYVLLANFAREPVHVGVDDTLETVLATHPPTLEPGYVVLAPLSGALLK